ncbi:MAG: hypothetical protein JXR03_15570 [Cyclobacteriaceae bacterium]
MIRALQLEWLKIRNYKVFWVLMGMYLLALLIITSGGMFFLEWIKSFDGNIERLDPTLIPLYDFPDIWQNTTYLGSFIKILLAFVVIISVNNDISYNTLRQNIIDGISKKEYLLSKLLFIAGLALFSSLSLFLMGLVNGSIYSHVLGASYIFDELEFLLAYAYDIVIFCTLAFLLSLVIKKAGFVIVFMALYSLMFEPILAVFLQYSPFTRDTAWAEFAAFLPINSLSNLIPVPFPKYFFREILTDVSLKTILIASGWFATYLSLIVFILNRRDLK